MNTLYKYLGVWKIQNASNVKCKTETTIVVLNTSHYRVLTQLNCYTLLLVTLSDTCIVASALSADCCQQL